MLKASLPSGINAPSERTIAINETGRAKLADPDKLAETRIELLRFLEDNGESSLKMLEKNFGTARVQRYVREFLTDGLVDAWFRSSSAKVKAKLRKAVKLIEVPDEPALKPLSEMQERVIQTISAAGGEMLYVELLEKAGVGASPINTLAKTSS